MPKAIFQAAYTLLAFSPFPDKDNYFLPVGGINLS